MESIKKLSKSGGITIPAVLRRDMGILSGEKFSVNVLSSGEIRFVRIDGRCIVCKDSKKLKKVDKVFVCESCYEKMKEVFEHDR